jgi:hypothetical protein
VLDVCRRETQPRDQHLALIAARAMVEFSPPARAPSPDHAGTTASSCAVKGTPMILPWKTMFAPTNP